MTTIHGPYKHGHKYRLRIREAGQQRVISFETVDAATREAKALRKAAALAASATVADALEEYDSFLTEKGNKPATIAVTLLRLRIFWRAHLDTAIVTIGADAAQKMADGLKTFKGERGRVMADDTRMNIVNQTRTFTRWCLRRKYFRVDPLVDVEIVGKRRRGKSQLTTDELRAFGSIALTLASEGDLGALAVLATLQLGVRANELLTRVVRDLDDRGTKLVISDAKTRTGNRRLRIPEYLRPLLARLIENKSATTLLFSDVPNADKNWLRRQVHRLCKLAGVSVVTTHGLRGSHASYEVDQGESGAALAAMLGHSSFNTTKAHYATADSVASAQIRKVESLLVPDGPPAGTKTQSSVLSSEN